MLEQDLEKLVSNFFTSLPRKKVAVFGKVEGWQKIQKAMRHERRMTSPRTSWFFWKFNKPATAILSIILATGLLTSVAKASQTSLPGETLYPVKKAVEKVEVALATSDEKKAEVLSNHAKKRLDEVSTLVQENKATKERVNETIVDLQNTTEKVVEASSNNPELTNNAIALTEQQEKVLSEVETKVEGETKELVQAAINSSLESLAKLKEGTESGEGGGEAIEGAVTENQPTSTPETVIEPTRPKPRPATTTAPQNDPEEVGSPIQVHDVFEDGPSTTPSNDPTIIDEPTLQF